MLVRIRVWIRAWIKIYIRTRNYYHEYDAQIVGNRITEVLVYKTFQTPPFPKVDLAPLQAILRSLLIQNASEYLQEDQLDQDHQGAPV